MTLIVLFVVFIIFRFLHMRWEEKKLEEGFGDEYRDFKKRVRLWV
ncbi:MAG: hypothetical protein ACXADO_09315 [Candidatus Thorarchaeota archaeon]|jgi:protein-S-isoprenylcysteine O-methyltransferase Ste14